MLYDTGDTATLNDAAHMYFAYHGNGVRFCIATLIYWDFVLRVCNMNENSHTGIYR